MNSGLFSVKAKRISEASEGCPLLGHVEGRSFSGKCGDECAGLCAGISLDVDRGEAAPIGDESPGAEYLDALGSRPGATRLGQFRMAAVDPEGSTSLHHHRVGQNVHGSFYSASEFPGLKLRGDVMCFWYRVDAPLTPERGHLLTLFGKSLVCVVFGRYQPSSFVTEAGQEPSLDEIALHVPVVVQGDVVFQPLHRLVSLSSSQEYIRRLAMAGPRELIQLRMSVDAQKGLFDVRGRAGAVPILSSGTLRRRRLDRFIAKWFERLVLGRRVLWSVGSGLNFKLRSAGARGLVDARATAAIGPIVNALFPSLKLGKPILATFGTDLHLEPGAPGCDLEASDDEPAITYSTESSSLH